MLYLKNFHLSSCKDCDCSCQCTWSVLSDVFHHWLQRIFQSERQWSWLYVRITDIFLLFFLRIFLYWDSTNEKPSDRFDGALHHVIFEQKTPNLGNDHATPMYHIHQCRYVLTLYKPFNLFHSVMRNTQKQNFVARQMKQAITKTNCFRN